ncbi:MAG: hypothetical protein AB7P31_12425 [Steroidobacteraceae bacterium]
MKTSIPRNFLFSSVAFGSTFKCTTSSLLDLMRWDATDQIGLTGFDGRTP